MQKNKGIRMVLQSRTTRKEVRQSAESKASDTTESFVFSLGVRVRQGELLHAIAGTPRRCPSAINSKKIRVKLLMESIKGHPWPCGPTGPMWGPGPTDAHRAADVHVCSSMLVTRQ